MDIESNMICNCEITPGNFADVKQDSIVLLKVAPNFNMKKGEFSGDKAYSSKLLYRIVTSVGLIPYIHFQDRVKKTTENSPAIWNEMFLRFRDNQEEWKKHYHKRSNVETVFSRVKLRLGEHLKCKNYHAQRSELMIKFVCHNILCLIQEIFESDIQIDFKKCSKDFIDKKVSEEHKTRDGGKVKNIDF